MAGWYARWIDKLERRLTSRNGDRRVLPFEWGLEWLDIHPQALDDAASLLGQWGMEKVEHSQEFFHHQPLQHFHFDGSILTFQSEVTSPYPENNTVWAAYFPAPKHRGRAVLVLPQWNADRASHVQLCKLLNRFGISALRMSLAYHEPRTPTGCVRAEFHVSPNLGRTIHAGRQSVLDARRCLDWLWAQGYRRIGILGTSLGSCIAYITAAHDPRVTAGVFNHISMHFGDVVWTGLATRHVRLGLEGHVTQDQLRSLWYVISPAAYLDRFNGRSTPSLMVWARYDSTFLPEYSRRFIAECRARQHNVCEACLPCGHYTTGMAPFNLLDGLHMCRFLYRVL